MLYGRSGHAGRPRPHGGSLLDKCICAARCVNHKCNSDNLQAAIPGQQVGCVPPRPGRVVEAAGSSLAARTRCVRVNDAGEPTRVLAEPTVRTRRQCQARRSCRDAANDEA
eukprot:4789881-Prymnesium_polylepis.1